jgi:hypothetical protein
MYKFEALKYKFLYFTFICFTLGSNYGVETLKCLLQEPIIQTREIHNFFRFNDIESSDSNTK